MLLEAGERGTFVQAISPGACCLWLSCSYLLSLGGRRSNESEMVVMGKVDTDKNISPSTLSSHRPPLASLFHFPPPRPVLSTIFHVHSLSTYTAGAAGKDGSFQAGDRIVSVDGISLAGMQLPEIFQLMQVLCLNSIHEMKTERTGGRDIEIERKR